MHKLLEIEPLLTQMTTAIQSYTDQHHYPNPLMIGIKRGGAWIAKKLHERLLYSEPLGELNIAFYRDDFSALGLHPEISSSQLTVDICDRHIILVDDVLYTGRTVRAAMNEIFDYGRPASITFAVLVDRSGRELPIQADIVGQTVHLKEKEQIKLLGPQPLTLKIEQPR